MSHPFNPNSMYNLNKAPMKNLLISFSGGLTSAFMVLFIKNNPKYKNYKIHVVFANTGIEHDNTLDFIHACDTLLNFNTVWLEAKVKRGKRGVVPEITNYEKAKRRGDGINKSPYAKIIEKFGWPSMQVRTCTRDLKERCIDKYMREVSNKYYTKAIGIRWDEYHANPNAIQKRGFAKKHEGGGDIIYPLANDIKCTASFVKKFWKTKEPLGIKLGIPARLGNCIICYLKSERKIATAILYGEITQQEIEWVKAMEENLGLAWHRSGKTMAEIEALAYSDGFIPDGAEIAPTEIDVSFPCSCS